MFKKLFHEFKVTSTILFLPLLSGKIAIFGRDFQLYSIIDRRINLVDLINLSEEISLLLKKNHLEIENKTRKILNMEI